MPPEDSHPMDLALSFWLDRILSEHCDEIEMARIRLAINNPSEQLEQLMAEMDQVLVDAMECWVTTVANAILFPVDSGPESD